MPVDDFPHLAQVLGTRVLVVQIVGVLPHVNVEEWHQVGAHISDQVLVRGRIERQLSLSLVEAEPAPARSLDGSRACVEHLNELVKGTPAFHDQVVKVSRRRDSRLRLRAQRVPEEFVVEMTASVELDGVGESDGCFDISAVQCLGLLVEQVVQVVDVGAMVLAVVELKQMARDDWLKGTHFVREGLEVDATLAGSVSESSLKGFSKHYKF